MWCRLFFPGYWVRTPFVISTPPHSAINYRVLEFCKYIYKCRVGAQYCSTSTTDFNSARWLATYVTTNRWYPKGQSYPSVDFGVRLSNFCDLNSHHGKQSIWGKACLKKDYHLCMLRQFCNFSQKTDPQQADTVTWFEILQLAGRTPQVR